MRFRLKTHTFLCILAYHQHTKTLENAEENRDFRKKQFQKWRCLKLHPFENAPFLVSTVENGGKY